MIPSHLVADNIDRAARQSMQSVVRRCRHVGELAGETTCKTCSGSVRVPTRLCELHGVPCVTAMRQPAGEVRWCRQCDDHEHDQATV